MKCQKSILILTHIYEFMIIIVDIEIMQININFISLQAYFVRDHNFVPLCYVTANLSIKETGK